MKAVFEGDAYIRPLGRGICLGPEMEHFEDWFAEAMGHFSQSDATVRVRITVETLPVTDAGAGEDA